MPGKRQEFNTVKQAIWDYSTSFNQAKYYVGYV